MFFLKSVFELLIEWMLIPPELSSDGLSPGHLHHGHVGQEARLDNSFRGKCYTQLHTALGWW